MNRHKSYKTLKILFIIGFAIQVILFFVPHRTFETYEAKWVKKAKITGITRLISAFTYVNTQRHVDLPSVIEISFRGLFLPIAFIILALSYHKRWIFIAGAIIMTLKMYLDLFFIGLPTTISINDIFYTYGLIGMVLCLAGFFIKPVK